MLVCLGCHHQIPKTGFTDLNKRHLFSHTSGGWKSKIKLPTWLVSSEVSLPALQMATFSLCPHVGLSYVLTERGAHSLFRVSSYKVRTPILLDQGPTLMTSFNLNYFLRGPISKYCCLGGWGFNIWIMPGENNLVLSIKYGNNAKLFYLINTYIALARHFSKCHAFFWMLRSCPACGKYNPRVLWLSLLWRPSLLLLCPCCVSAIVLDT